MGRDWLTLGTCLWLCTAACAGAAAGGRDPLAKPGLRPEPQGYAGDPSGPPRIEGLPEPDVERDELSDDMKRAWLLAEESLAVDPPSAPGSSTAESIEEWSDTTLRDWLERKSSRAMAARRVLNQAALHSLRERILAGAIMGLVYEDVAGVLTDLPIPDELRSEPEIERVYREVMLSNAEPFLANARAAYDACAGNAKALSSLTHWGRFCARRRNTLPDAKVGAAPGTVVSVERGH